MALDDSFRFFRGRSLLLLLVLVIAYQGTNSASTGHDPLSEEHRLMKTLLNQQYYDPGVRPVFINHSKVRVSIGMAMVSLVELHPKDETISVNCWLRFAWKDVRLKWNPADFGGVDHTRIKWNKIWRPDIVLYNGAEEQSMNPSFDDTMAVVQSNGGVMYIPHLFLTATCAMDLTYFPRDTQRCYFKFGSWTFDGFKLDIDFFEGVAKVDLSDYRLNKDWEILKAPSKKNVKKYPCCKELYPDITYSLVMRRRGSLLLYGGPAMFLAFMIPLIFLLPHGTGDKASMGFCILICLTLLIASLEDVITTPRMPILVYYYVFCFFLTGISLILTTFVNGILSGVCAAPPHGLVKFFKCVGKIMCVTAGSTKVDSFALVDGESSSSPSCTNARATWIFIATVIDRILCLVFVIIVSILTGTFIGRIY